MKSAMAQDVPGSIDREKYQIALLGAVIFSACIVTTRIIRNLFFHPLAQFPGPWYTAISNLWYCWSFLGGRHPYRVLALHKKYGSVVRIAPNELSFNNAQSWKDIYDFKAGKRCMIKSNFYEGGTFADQCGSIVAERDPDKHGQMRRYLSHAFSQRSLNEQEALIASIIDSFMDRLDELRKGGETVDMTQWFNMMTFDIIGELAFGESFGGIKSGEFHPWISRITGAMKQGAMADTFKRFPAVGKVMMTLMAGAIEKIMADCKKNEEYSLQLVEKRTSKPSERKDFLSRILEHRDEENISNVQIAAHSADFVTAGSETTATTLSCITYYLLKDKSVLTKLQDEIRTAFSSYDQINAASTAQLRYLDAVCQEGMRIFPPLPIALPRIVPAEGDVVDGHVVPGGIQVSTNPIAACLDPANFADPLDFKPERWLDPNGTDNYNASQPFSTGPRGCLGRSLGWMELRTTLAKLHYNFDLKLEDGELDWQRDARMHTLWQKPALLISIHARQT